jgi:hypothetical protein
LRRYAAHEQIQNIRRGVQRAVAAALHYMQLRAYAGGELRTCFVTSERIAVTQHNVARRTAASLRVECIGEVAACTLDLKDLSVGGAKIARPLREMFTEGFEFQIDAAQQGFGGLSFMVPARIHIEGEAVEER